jgi:hypothetical protein
MVIALRIGSNRINYISGRSVLKSENPITKFQTLFR